MTDFNLSEDQLSQMIPGNQHVSEWWEALNTVLPEYDLITPERAASFISQCAHESNNFTAIKENLNYRAVTLRKVFPKYFPTDALAAQYEHRPEMIANKVYGNRMGNGDELSGDGFRYCGRGLIQLTGKNNYSHFADSIGMELSDVPEYLATFEGAVKSAAWFWNTNKLNALADTGDVMAVTKRINGGTIGYDDRLSRYNQALTILTT